MTEIEIRGETLHLLPAKALYFPKRRLIGLADVHLGKAASLQSQGLPVPELAAMDLARIAELIEAYDPERVALIGDWIHAPTAWTRLLDTLLGEFFAAYPKVRFQLIVGNHERGSIERLKRAPLEIFQEEMREGPFVLSHGHEPVKPGEFAIQGHIHPVVTIRRGPLHLRLPVFWWQSDSLTLPSFGELTGGYEIRPAARDRIFGVAGAELLEIPVKPASPEPKP